LKKPGRSKEEKTPFIFDLDGTLIDSVYQHVLAWREALENIGIQLSNWRIHRRVGMSGGLIAQALTRETGRCLTPEEAERVQRHHTDAYLRRVEEIRPLPGAIDLLEYLSGHAVPWTVATSSTLERAARGLEMLGVGADVPVVTRDLVRHGKPDPDLFVTAAQRLGFSVSACLIVGDSVWDLLAARRAGALGVGLLSGGYGEEELMRAGAFRVYDDPADLLKHLDELGVRPDL
jgi:HAD superfamily hydrolase (TIGR01509 family)